MNKKFTMLTILFIMLVLVFAACSSEKSSTNKNESENNNAENEVTYNPPSMDDLDPNDPDTDLILKGEELFNETNTVASDYVGNELSCQSCHADGGIGESSSLVGTSAQFPEYRPREGKVFSIEDRINGCMIRSMNGKMFEEDSEELEAMTAYINKLSEGIEEGDDLPWRMHNTMEEIPEPDVDHGEELYDSKNCLTCHADDGSGTGANSGPALWGDKSFNDGAGLNRMTKMAGYLKNNMPKGNENLTDQEAADLAAYLLSFERPVWEGHDDDWPKEDDERPTDIITKDRREQIQEGTFDWTEIDNIIPKDKVEKE